MSKTAPIRRDNEFSVGFLRYRNNNTSAEKQLQQRKHCFWLSVWKNWYLEKRNAKEIKITSRSSLTLLERFYAEIENKHG